jgi:protein-S-isoprenylcysteine O-methyltransferase Ste14
MTPTSALFGLLAVFILSWVAAALWAGRTVVALPDRAQWPLLAGGLLAILFLAIARALFPAFRVRLWEENLAIGWSMVAVSAIGYAWCWWARVHLGNLWSAGVSRKEGHRVVDTGPYGIVRHPIYTGAMLAVFAFATAFGRPFDFLVALVFTVFFICKARVEERFLREELGVAYDAFRQRVPMLLPLLRLRAPR